MLRKCAQFLQEMVNSNKETSISELTETIDLTTEDTSSKQTQHPLITEFLTESEIEEAEEIMHRCGVVKKRRRQSDQQQGQSNLQQQRKRFCSNSSSVISELSQIRVGAPSEGSLMIQEEQMRYLRASRSSQCPPHIEFGDKFASKWESIPEGEDEKVKYAESLAASDWSQDSSDEEENWKANDCVEPPAITSAFIRPHNKMEDLRFDVDERHALVDDRVQEWAQQQLAKGFIVRVLSRDELHYVIHHYWDANAQRVVADWSELERMLLDVGPSYEDPFRIAAMISRYYYKVKLEFKEAHSMTRIAATLQPYFGIRVADGEYYKYQVMPPDFEATKQFVIKAIHALSMWVPPKLRRNIFHYFDTVFIATNSKSDCLLIRESIRMGLAKFGGTINTERSIQKPTTRLPAMGYDIGNTVGVSAEKKNYVLDQLKKAKQTNEMKKGDRHELLNAVRFVGTRRPALWGLCYSLQERISNSLSNNAIIRTTAADVKCYEEIWRWLRSQQTEGIARTIYIAVDKSKGYVKGRGKAAIYGLERDRAFVDGDSITEKELRVILQRITEEPAIPERVLWLTDSRLTAELINLCRNTTDRRRPPQYLTNVLQEVQFHWEQNPLWEIRHIRGFENQAALLMDKETSNLRRKRLRNYKNDYRAWKKREELGFSNGLPPALEVVSREVAM